ncbi:MAG: hypothetical protein ACI8P0_002197 [Planctomycetaceae bacterium]
MTTWEIVVVSWPKLGSLSGFCARLLLFFHRLFEAEAFTIHLEDVAMVGESIQQGRRHAFALEDLAPVAKREVAGDQQAAAFVAVGEDLEQQLGSGPTERQVAQFVDDQQVDLVEPFQELIEAELLVRFFQLVNQRRGREELRADAFTASGESQGD